MVLALTLAGGAQACVAVCTVPYRPSPVVAQDAIACRHCGTQHPATNEHKSGPTTPCKHCQSALQDRLAVPSDQLVKAPAEYMVFAPAPLVLPAAVVVPTRIDTHPPGHPPPGQVLLQSCVLLI